MEAQSIVARLRAAKGREREEVLGGLYAEKVDLRHVPPSEHDGVMSREQLVAGAAAERGLFENAIPDFNSTHSYEVEGERIVEQFHIRGTLRDGQVLDNRMTITYTVSDGAIERDDGGDRSGGVGTPAHRDRAGRWLPATGRRELSRTARRPRSPSQQ